MAKLSEARNGKLVVAIYDKDILDQSGDCTVGHGGNGAVSLRMDVSLWLYAGSWSGDVQHSS
jgi:hypothetical protein